MSSFTVSSNSLLTTGAPEQKAQKLKRRLYTTGFVLVAGLLSLASRSAAHGQTASVGPLRLLLDTDENGECAEHAVGMSIFLVCLMSLVILYVFYAFHVLCEHYFIHAMIAVCDQLALSEDVAGATFLAAGSSIPEMVSNFDDAFFIQNDIGLGTIVGSAVFNILFGLAACSFVCPPDHTIHPSAVYRDSFYFTLSIAMVFVFFYDGKVYWYESMCLVLAYVVYVIHLMNSGRIMQCLGYQAVSATVPGQDTIPALNGALNTALSSDMGEDEEDDMIRPSMALQQDHSKNSRNAADLDLHHDLAMENNNGRKDSVLDMVMPSGGQSTDAYNQLDLVDEEETGEEVELHVLGNGQHTSAPDNNHHGTAPTSCCGKFAYILAFPLQVIFKFTIVNCDTDATKKRWPITFAISILYFIVLCYLMVYLGSAMSCLTNISATVMGFTLLAVGTSLPDCLGGLAAAKQGYVGMAISNALGSNSFDIMAALGLPWMLYSMIHNVPMDVDEKQLIGPSISMLLSVVILLLTLNRSKWKLNKQTGTVFLMSYIAFLVYVLAFDEEE